MKRYRADLHIHTVLSACADLEMSPGAIVREAKNKNLDIIGITDHNSTLQCRLVKELAEEAGLAVLCGAEVTTREEVHCLAYFGDPETLGSFQAYLDTHLPVVKYRPESLGYQLVVDKNERIVRQIDNWLNIGLRQGIDAVEKEVHRLGGLFMPAHIERAVYGIFNQLGFIPDNLVCDGMGIMSISREQEIRSRFIPDPAIPLVRASDAHCLAQVGTGITWFEMEEITFGEIRQALAGRDGRKTWLA